MFIWWRAWDHRNNIIFDKGNAFVDNPIRFLQNYHATLQDIANGGEILNRKGKEKSRKIRSSIIFIRRRRELKNLERSQKKVGLNVMSMLASLVQR